MPSAMLLYPIVLVRPRSTCGNMLSSFSLSFFADPPIVSIQLGRSLVAADIRQGNDVYFNCDIRANPAPKTKIVTWLHNVSELIRHRKMTGECCEFLLTTQLQNSMRKFKPQQ